MKKILTKDEIKRLDEKIIEASIATQAVYHYVNEIMQELRDNNAEVFRIKENFSNVLEQVEKCKVELSEYKVRISD